LYGRTQVLINGIIGMWELDKSQLPRRGLIRTWDASDCPNAAADSCHLGLVIV
jgi:hypothetical protein